jgi:hypothetical protein
LLVYDNEELVGIAPLISRKIKRFGLLTIQSLEFLGTGENAEDEICSLYLDFITITKKEELVYKAIYEYLFKHIESWDEIILSEVLRPEKYKNFFQAIKTIYHLS